MAHKPEPKDQRPDIGFYPAMHPYPGFTTCAACGGQQTWEKEKSGGGRWVSPMGAEHDCTETRKHLTALAAARSAHTDGAAQLAWLAPTQAAKAA